MFYDNFTTIIILNYIKLREITLKYIKSKNFKSIDISTKYNKIKDSRLFPKVLLFGGDDGS